MVKSYDALAGYERGVRLARKMILVWMSKGLGVALRDMGLGALYAARSGQTIPGERKAKLCWALSPAEDFSSTIALATLVYLQEN